MLMKERHEMHLSLLCCPLPVTTLKTRNVHNFQQTLYTHQENELKNPYKNNFIQNKATKIDLCTKYVLKRESGTSK